MFEVENGIEIPAPKRGRGRPPKYPWAEMEIGDSFFVEAQEGRSIENQQRSLSASGRSYGVRKHVGMKFRTRTVEGGVRVWRIE